MWGEGREGKAGMILPAFLLFVADGTGAVLLGGCVRGNNKGIGIGIGIGIGKSKAMGRVQVQGLGK